MEMKLSNEEKNILNGEKGKVLQKVMRSVIAYADAIGADRLVNVDGPGHSAIPWAIPGVGARLEMLAEWVEAGLKTKFPFTLDASSPLDYHELDLPDDYISGFDDLLKNQPKYDHLIAQLGLRSKKDYTCTPYLEQVGNIPIRGQIIAWSESSCVVYANSVLGARTHRNATLLDILSNFLGKTPLAGLLTDEGRKAKWLIEIKTTAMPNPQMLGGAIGIKVMDDVPYIAGLDRFLREIDSESKIDFLKDMGAASAALGAVGLYHAENITPEAIDHGRSLLIKDYQKYVIDDAVLEDLMNSYPIMWNDKKAEPRFCLIGCPHLSLRQLNWWAHRIKSSLEAKQKKRVAVKTILCAAPHVIEKFTEDKTVSDWMADAGVKLSGLCSEMFMNNQACANDSIVTNSNKLRAFTTARMFFDEQLVEIITSGRINKE
jgi:predicted aconitase